MFLEDLYPDKMVSSVYDLDWEALAKRYQGAMFDIDNTLVPHGAPADERSAALFKRLHGLGIKTMLVSNNKDKRVRPFAEALRTQYVCKAGKPKQRGYREAIRRLGMDSGRIVFVGDQIFTDIWGANIAGMDTILTEPIDASTDEPQIVIKRKVEWPFRRAKKRKRGKRR